MKKKINIEERVYIAVSVNQNQTLKYPKMFYDYKHRGEKKKTESELRFPLRHTIELFPNKFCLFGSDFHRKENVSSNTKSIRLPFFFYFLYFVYGAARSEEANKRK